MKQFAVLGLGDFGVHLAKTLSEGNAEVIAADSDSKRVQLIKGHVAHAIELDTTNEAALIEAGIKDVDVGIVCIGKNIEASILTTALLKKLHVPEVIARSVSDVHTSILRELGASKIVSPERDAGVRLGRNLLITKITDSVELAQGYVLSDVKAPKSFIGKTLRELDLRNKFKTNIIALKRMERLGRRASDPEQIIEYMGLPNPEDVIQAHHVLVLVGKEEDIDRIASLE